MSRFARGSRPQKDKYGRDALFFEDDVDSRSTRSTEASDDERPSRTSSASTSLPKEEGRKQGAALLGLLNGREYSNQVVEPPPPPPPPLLPPKTRLHSGASLFIPQNTVGLSFPQQWEGESTFAEQRGTATANDIRFQGASALPTHCTAADKEMLCWEFVHHGWCPRKSTCRWLHPSSDVPATPFDDNSADIGLLQYETSFPMLYEFSQTAFAPQDGQWNLNSEFMSADHEFLGQCVSLAEADMAYQAAEGWSTATPAALPLIDMFREPMTMLGVDELQDPEDSGFNGAQLPVEVDPSSKVAESIEPAKTSSKVLWADLQEEDDVDEPFLPQWQCHIEEDDD